MYKIGCLKKGPLRLKIFLLFYVDAISGIKKKQKLSLYHILYNFVFKLLSVNDGKS